MTKGSLSTSVLKKIQEEQLKPKPKWHFWLKNGLFWTVFAIAVLIGSRAVGVVIKVLSSPDYFLIAKAKGDVVKPLLAILPLFWMSFFLLFLILAMLGLHQTKKGYKLCLAKLIGVNLLLSFILGGTSYAIGDAHRFEEQMKRQAPIIKTTEERRQKVWNDPQEGRLAGMVIQIDDNHILFLDDITTKRWAIDFSNSQMWTRFEIRPQMKIRVVGQQTDDNTFVAEVIGQWERPPR